MELDPNKRYVVELNTHGLNMLWATKGYQHADGTPSICYWDDIHTVIKNEAGEEVHRSVPTLDARSYIQSQIDDLEGEFGKMMEIKFPGYTQEEYENSGFGMSLQNLIKCNEITYSYYWMDEKEYPEGECMDGVPGAPKDDKGRFPVDINIYVPIESLTKPVVENAIDNYIRKFMLINNFEIKWVDMPADADVEKDWIEEEERIKEWSEMRARGEQLTILMLPQFMGIIFGEEKIKSLVERGLKHGQKVGNDVILTFEDGHTEILKEDEGDSIEL